MGQSKESVGEEEKVSEEMGDQYDKKVAKSLKESDVDSDVVASSPAPPSAAEASYTESMALIAKLRSAGMTAQAEQLEANLVKPKPVVQKPVVKAAPVKEVPVTIELESASQGEVLLAALKKAGLKQQAAELKETLVHEFADN